MPNKIIPYRWYLKKYARQLRKKGVLSEVILWKQFRRKGTGVEFHRQVPIDDFIVDFYCHELMLAIEVDGISHSFEGAMQKDEKRQDRLESLGVRFLRIQDADVKNDIGMVVNAIRMKIAELTHPPCPLPPRTG